MGKMRQRVNDEVDQEGEDYDDEEADDAGRPLEEVEDTLRQLVSSVDMLEQPSRSVEKAQPKAVAASRSIEPIQSEESDSVAALTAMLQEPNVTLVTHRLQVDGASLAGPSPELGVVQQRQTDLEANQVVLEENQGTLQEENVSLREHVAALEKRCTFLETSLTQVLRLFDLKQPEVELVTADDQPAASRVRILHEAPAFAEIVSHNNSLAEAVNAMADQLEALAANQQQLQQRTASSSVTTTGYTLPSAVSPASSSVTRTYYVDETAEAARRSPAPLPLAVQPTPHRASPVVVREQAPTPTPKPAGLPVVGLEISDGGDATGFRIVSVKNDGPADVAGLEVDDFILQFNGQNVDTRDEFKAALQGCGPEERVTVQFVRSDSSAVQQTSLLLGGTSSGGTRERRKTATLQQQSPPAAQDRRLVY